MRRMNKKKIKFSIGGLIIFLVIGYLAFSGMKGTMLYYVTPSELLNKGEDAYAQGVRLSGLVENGSIERDDLNLLLNFKIKDDKNEIFVRYNGIIPDTFKAGAEVVVEGNLRREGFFEATTLLAKCPSKYDTDEKI